MGLVLRLYQIDFILSKVGAWKLHLYQGHLVEPVAFIFKAFAEAYFEILTNRVQVHCLKLSWLEHRARVVVKLELSDWLKEMGCILGGLGPAQAYLVAAPRHVTA